MLFDQVLNNNANRLREIIAVILDWCDNKPKTPYRAKGVNPAAWKHNLEHANLPKPSNIVTGKRRAAPAARSLRRRCAGPATASTPSSRSTAWGARSVIGSETTPSSPESLPNLPSLTHQGLRRGCLRASLQRRLRGCNLRQGAPRRTHACSDSRNKINQLRPFGASVPAAAVGSFGCITRIHGRGRFGSITCASMSNLAPINIRHQSTYLT